MIRKMLFDLTTTQEHDVEDKILIVVVVVVDKTTSPTRICIMFKMIKFIPHQMKHFRKKILIVYLLKMIGEIWTLFVNICPCTLSQYHWLKIYHSLHHYFCTIEPATSRFKKRDKVKNSLAHSFTAAEIYYELFK